METEFKEGLRSLCKMAGVELSGDEDEDEIEPVDLTTKKVKVAPMNVIPTINTTSRTSSKDEGSYEGMETRAASPQEPQELDDLYPDDYRGSPELGVIEEVGMAPDLIIEANIIEFLEELRKADPFDNPARHKRRQPTNVMMKILEHHDLRRRMEIGLEERKEHIEIGVDFLHDRAALNSRMPDDKLAVVGTKVFTCLKNMLEFNYSDMLLTLACFLEITSSHSNKKEDYLKLEKDLILEILPVIDFMK